MPASTPYLRLQKLIDEPRILLGSHGNVLLSVWREAPDVRVLQDIERACSRLRSETQSRLGFLSIINPLPVVPDEALRREMVKMMDLLGQDTFAMAAVIEATGFIGATFRGVIGALNLASRAPYPRKVFGTVPDAAAWLAPLNERGGAPVSGVAELTAAVAELRAGGKR